MLRPPWNRSCSLLAHLLFDLITRATGMNVLWLRRLCNDAIDLVGTDQFAFPSVPLGENLGRRRASENTGMDQAWEADAGDVARGAEYAFEIPNRFRAVVEITLSAKPRFKHKVPSTVMQGTRP